MRVWIDVGLLYIITALLWGLFALTNQVRKRNNTFWKGVLCFIGNTLLCPLAMVVAMYNFDSNNDLQEAYYES